MLCFYVIILNKNKGNADPSNANLWNTASQTTSMITLYYENDNIFNQDTYDKIINQVDFLTLECPSRNHSCCLIKHARYSRSFRLPNSVITINIVRVLCKECGKTHAVLLCDFVPYSQILLNNQIEIIKSDNDEKYLSDNRNFDMSDLKYISKQFNLYWKQRLLSHSITLNQSLLITCFKFFCNHLSATNWVILF